MIMPKSIFDKMSKETQKEIKRLETKIENIDNKKILIDLQLRELR